MATAAPNSVAALAATANPFGGETAATASSCVEDPNFATICSFIQNFGEIIRIGKIPFDDLQQMLENNADVPLPLVQLHITLLRRVFKSVSHDKWERSLAKFGHMYCSQDAWEIERFGYKKAKIQTKLRLLKNLLEAQFDYNVKFKAEVNKLQAADLRLTPLGRDTEGQVYWYQVDEDANLRVYREDIDDETWDIVASNRDELEDLISRLQRGEVKKPEPEETIIVPEEDSNSKDDIEPKEIILDTGKVEDDGSNGDNSCESDEFEDGKQDKRTVEPLIIKHSFNLSKIQNSDVESAKSNVDDVKYEISKSTEDENSPGIKLVFGVKSRPKTEIVTPQLEAAVSSMDFEIPSETPISTPKAEKTSPVELTLPASKAPSQIPTKNVQSNKPEDVSVNKSEETRVASNDGERNISSQNKESSPIIVTSVDTRISEIFGREPPVNTELPSKTEQRGLHSKIDKQELRNKTENQEPQRKTEKRELQSKAKNQEPQGKIEKQELQSKAKNQELQSKIEKGELLAKTENQELQSKIEKRELLAKTEKQELQSKIEKRELLAKTEKQELQSKIEKRELLAKTEKQELQNKVEQRKVQSKDEQQELRTNIEQRKPEDEKLELQSKHEQPEKQSRNDQQQLPIRTEKQDLQTKNEQVETQAKLEKQLQQAKADKQELEAKVAKRELQSKASKNLQKSAKVNSIVERLNRKLPENSPKTVADLIPPPEFKRQDNILQKHDSQNLLLNFKSKSEVVSSTSNLISAVPESKKKSDVDLSAIIQSEASDYTKTTLVEAEFKKHLEKHEPACKMDTSTEDEEIRHPQVVPNPNLNDAVIETTIKSATSITLESHVRTERVTVQESTVERRETKLLNKSPDALEIKQSNNGPKDSGTEKPIDSPVVPMDVSEPPTFESKMPVIEEVLEKKEAYIYGREEQVVVKENAWVCGKEEALVKEPVVVKENAWVCGKEEALVKEPVVVKEKVWVCGDTEKTSKESDLLTSNSANKEESLQDISIPPVPRSDDDTIVTQPPAGFTSLSSVSYTPQDVCKDSTSPALDLVKGMSNKIPSERLKTECTFDVVNVACSSVSEVKLDTKSILANEDDTTAISTSALKNNTVDLQTAAIVEKKADEVVLPSGSANSSEVREEKSADLVIASSDITPTVVPIPVKNKEAEVEVTTAIKIPPVDESTTKVSNFLPPSTTAPLPIDEGTVEISTALSENKETAKTLPIEDKITKMDTIASNLECAKNVSAENQSDIKPAPSEVILSGSSEPSISEVKSSGPPTQLQTPTEETVTDINTDASHVPPQNVTHATPVEGIEDNNDMSQNVPPLTEVKEHLTNIIPEIPLSEPQKSLPQNVGADNESSVQNANNETKSKESEPTDLLVKKSMEIHQQASKETPPASAKANSSLVLYSESSESSNEAFATDVKNEKPVPTESPAKNNISEVGTENSLTFALKDKIAAISAPNSHPSDSTTSTLANEPVENLVQSSTAEKSSTDNELVVTQISNANVENKNDTPKETESQNSDVPAIPSISIDSVTTSKPSVTDSTPASSSAGTKRKADDEVESFSKIQKLENTTEPLNEATATAAPETPLNPIIGETVEEDVMTITGEGSGAMNEGRNSPVPFNPICGETIEEEVMTITGFGFGILNEGSNENSPASLAVADVAGSQNESIDSDGSRDAFQSSRGRGGRRGRGRRGRPPAGATRERTSQPATTPRNNNRGSRGSREVARLGVSLDSVEVNGENERPVRASRRIAQIRLKEEEERRKLEEERLAQLKAAQMQKKAKQAEKEKGKTDNQTPVLKTKKGPGKKSLKGELHFAPDYVPSGSESEEENSEEEDGSDEFSGKLGKGGKQRRRRKNGKAKKGGNPWATSDEDEEEEQVEEEEEYHYEEEEEEDLVFKSDHEFSPESDLGEDDAVGPSRHARTAKQDKGDLFEEGNCCKCGKGDHPEWILLCDKCDKGWHASCLRPQLWVVPEGEWFCPPCQHNMLIENLSKNLVEYESLLKKRENEILRKQRLAYVGISLDNVLPDKEPEIPEPDLEQVEKVDREKRRQRRRILSDEELSDDFINDGDSNDDLSRSRSGSSNEDSEDEPVYRLRARRSKKAFNFKEYDDMINSALRVDDDEEGGEMEKMDQEEEEENGDDSKLNGEEEEEEDDKGAGGGKNEAYLKHLEKQAQEEEETDEELLDEKERLRRKELAKHGQKKARRRINDLDAYSDEEDSDDDFKASEAEDDEEELAEDGESEWSGDKMEEDSDDSIAKRARRKDRQGRHGRLGRREKYSDKGLVRRSTRKRRSRISYDESDDEDEEEEDQNDKWQSDESEEEEESESNSDSDDTTWGKKKKKGFAAAKPKLSNFVLGASGSKGKGKGGVKRKKRKTDEDDVDRPWNSARGKKEKDEPIERRTRGRKINFKDILDSGESDDDGNVRPKRRPLSDSDDSRSPSSSRRLAEEIRAENARKEREYEENKAKMAEGGSTGDKSKLEDAIAIPIKEIPNNGTPSSMPEALTIAKMAESSVNQVAGSTIINVPPAHVSAQVSPLPISTLPPVPSPKNLTPMSSPLHSTSSPSAVVPAPVPITVPPNSSPINLHTTTPPIGVPSTITIVANTSAPSVLPKSPPPLPFIPKSVSSISVGSVLSNLPAGLIPSNLSTRQAPPPSISSGPVHQNLSARPLPPNISARSVPPALSAGHMPPNSSVGNISPNAPVGSSRKSIVSPIPLPVPVPIITDKRSHKQSKGSRSSRGSKAEKQLPPPVSTPSDLELALSKPVKTPTTLGSPLPKSSSKKKDRERESSITVPNPSLLMAGAGGVLPELLGMGLPSSLRPGGSGVPGSTTPPSSGGSSSKKGKSSSSRTTQQTTPPPVSQNLSPSLPIDIDRVPNPALFQGNPGMRPFHPMWAVRNPGPPPPGYSPPGSSSNLGKPPPLNTSPFSGQQGPPSRPGFPSPPPLRIPNPNTSPLQAFQHFKRDGPLGGQLYRLPPGQPQPLPNILPPGMMSPHSGGPERFFAAPPGYPHPYGLLPPHSQGPPQALFPYDYRAPEPPFKDEPAPPRTTASSLPTPVSSASSSPPPTASAPVPLSTKDEGSAARDSEFGGLVSYFSSQRSEEDMDT